MPHACEAKGCTSDAHIGVQFIQARDVRMAETRWLCIVCLSPALRQMADAVDTVGMIAAIKFAERFRR